MSTLTKGLLIIAVILAVGVGLVFWKSNVAASHGEEGEFSKVTKEEMELILQSFNPMQLKTLSEDPSKKKELAAELEEFLAIASQAKKEGVDQKEPIKTELEGLEQGILAAYYDQKINQDKGNLPPFSFIKQDRVDQFWNGGEDGNFLTDFFNKARAQRRENEFKKFIDGKIELARSRGQLPPGQEPSEEELKPARETFAKINITYEEAKEKLANIDSLPESEREEWRKFREQVELQTMLQKAQFLNQAYVQEYLPEKVKVTDEEIQAYIKAHPELTKSAGVKAKADEVLQRIKSGADFGELAKEFSEDPGSKERGGLYEGVVSGQFLPEFENAALALQPGQVTPSPVKTKYGYHIIKLEKKGATKDPTGNSQPSYDVRHILFSTMIKDPENPFGRELPVEDFVKAKLEQEKQKQILEEIKKNNKVEVAQDFVVPKPSEEDIKKMQEMQEQQMQQQLQQLQQQQQQQQQAPPPPPPAEAAPAEPNKEN